VSAIVRIRVGDSAEDRMIVKQALEAADIGAHGKDQQQKRKGDGDPRHGNVSVPAETPGEHTGSARDQNEESREETENHGERKQPAGNELPRGRVNRKKFSGLPKIGVNDAGSLGCIPK